MNSWQKRSIDVVEITAVTPLAIGLVALGALFVKLESGDPVFYSQPRMGKREKPFKIFKIRTMKDSGLQYIFPKPTNDDRTTRVGKILRPLAIDELPQLIVNILIRHDMSLFGIRAYPVNQYYDILDLQKSHPDIFTKELVNNWKKAYDCAPPGGLSLALARGRSSHLSSYDALKKKMEYDIEYVANASPIYDIKILFETIAVYLTKNGSW